MRFRRRWLAVVVPIAVIGVIEVSSDTFLDPLLPFPRDTAIVMVALCALALLYSRYAFRLIDRLTDALRRRNEELERRHAAAAALHRVSIAMTALVDIEAVLQAVVEHGRGLLGADVAVLALATQGGELRVAASAGPEAAIDPTGRQPGDDFRCFIRPAYLVANLAAPLQRGDRTIGTLAVGGRTPRAYGVDDVETLSSLASQAVIALENDRLQRELRELAVRGERERIAREMHDGLAQVLGYVNTKSQAVEELLAAGRVDAARSQLEQLSTAARSVYVDVREAILGLASPIPPDRGLVSALEQYVDRFADASKLAGRVESTEQARRAGLRPPVQYQVLRNVQEALTNVRKHAAAQRVTVTVDADGDALRVAVTDDGKGLAAASTPAEDWPHYGLQAMRERAASVGAELSFEAADGRGTRVVLHVPMADASGRRVA
jgi:nitrate/nitrite-specific signal transduction histidine kinase